MCVCGEGGLTHSRMLTCSVLGDFTGMLYGKVSIQACVCLIVELSLICLRLDGLANAWLGELSSLRPPELTSLRATELLVFLCTNELTCLWLGDVFMAGCMNGMCMAGWVDIHVWVIGMITV